MKLLFGAGLLAATLIGCQGDETVRAYGAKNRIWTLTELNGTPFSSRATLSFPDPETVTGEAPCNSYTAAMTAPYPWFETGPIAATKRACPDMAAEAAFLQNLAAATLSEVSGTTLILSDPTGLSLVFQAAD